MNLDTILVPTDFSSPADAALRYAVELASRVGSKVIVLHAFVPSVLPILDGAIIPTASELAEEVSIAEKRLAELAVRFARTGMVLETKAVQGAAVEEILRVTQAQACDLIVMGTHGRTGLARIALGSVAERVVRAAPVPVLTIRTKSEPVASLFESPPLL